MGLTVEEASGPPAEILPENQTTVDVFIAMSTQWRTGMGGPIGLDYNALHLVMRMSSIRRDEWPFVFDGVRAMEAAALEKMREK
ncbi:hypothetical protein TSA66_00925 [Noviherbaspirillum autotrophicum]|uniref:Uncharacterized protein n=1 Tax=Noviherbaspirillum autotrophicum TaxID=709839 RepID=A0A0C1YJY9_9BURK|nr:hypothetical protein TSA66_08235 [Noviherbaspirillum autotrophicum]KIF84037.1 hypothetical protein TSA66_00925 [Noviherbaspirillum autotrophicum]